MFHILSRAVGTLRRRVRAWAEAQAVAAELNSLSDRQLADMALKRSDIDAIVHGTYVDPRPAIANDRAAIASAPAPTPAPAPIMRDAGIKHAA